jgi:DNA-binding SARP family transcriptional activator/tetratricopeptide (TPR) repeat protein
MSGDGSGLRDGDALRVQLLGALRVWRGGREVALGAPARRAVLALLALAGGRPLTRAALVAGLWEGEPPPSAVNVIHTHVRHLRRALEPDRQRRAPSTALPAVGDGYALAVPPEAVDALRFRRLVAAAEVARREGNPGRTADLLAEALGLWHGEVLSDLPFLAGHPEVLALAEERWTALGRSVDAGLARGRAAEVLGAARDAATARPLDEAAQARLVRTYHALGRRAEAFAVHRETSRRLVEDLGADPGPELVTAYRDLLADTPPPVSSPVVPEAPAVALPAQLPAPPAHFVGRADLLARLEALLAGDRRPAGVALTGPAGAGKTALALVGAHRVSGEYPDGQLFLDLHGDRGEEATGAGQALAHLLGSLGVPPDRVPAGTAERAALYRSLLHHRRVLVVLDNAAGSGQVAPLLPAGPGCGSLVTSRNQLAVLTTEQDVHAVSVDVLSPAEAVDLLAGVLGADRTGRDPAAAAELAERCGRLPLALRIAAARLRISPGRTLGDLADELADERSRLSALSVERQSRSVRSVFASSYGGLGDPQARLFRLLGLHPGTTFGIHQAAALAGWPVAETRRILDDLLGACLLTEAAGGRYAFHDLVRLYAAERAEADEPPARRAEAVARLLDWYLAIAEAANQTLTPANDKVSPAIRNRPARLPFTADRAEVLAVLDAERASLPRVVRHAAEHGHPRAGWQLAYLTYGFFEHRGQGVEGIDTCRWGLAAAERDAGAPVALMLLHAGMARLETGRPEEALPYLQRSLELRKATGGPREQAVALINLGIAYRHLDRLDDALDAYRHAVDLLATAGDERALGVCLLNLGCLYTARDDPAEGLAHLRRALEIQRRTGDDHSAGYTLTSMGEAHLRAGEIHAALDRLREALALQQRIGDRHTAATSHDTLGRCQQLLGDHRSALDHFTQALETHRASGDDASAARTRTYLEASTTALALLSGRGRGGRRGGSARSR